MRLLTRGLRRGNYPGMAMFSLTESSVTGTIRSTFHCNGLMLTAVACGKSVFPFVHACVRGLARHDCRGHAVNLVRGKD